METQAERAALKARGEPFGVIVAHADVVADRADADGPAPACSDGHLSRPVGQFSNTTTVYL